MGASATEAWSKWHDHDVLEPEVGDFPYFHANDGNGFFGHVGVLVDADEFVSVTATGVRRYSVSWWSANVAELLGYQRWWS